jgi:hypothetical protein
MPSSRARPSTWPMAPSPAMATRCSGVFVIEHCLQQMRLPRSMRGVGRLGSIPSIGRYCFSALYRAGAAPGLTPEVPGLTPEV